MLGHSLESQEPMDMNAQQRTGPALAHTGLPTCQCGRHRDAGLIPGSGRSHRGGHGNPLQYSRLENPMDGGAWKAIVHGVHKESDPTE